MNIALLEKAKQSILSDPKFDMSEWDHCICGHIAKLSGLSSIPTSRVATVLQIGNDQARNLFFWSNWPKEYRYNRGEVTSNDPVNACHLIDYFVKADGRFPVEAPRGMFSTSLDYAGGFFRRRQVPQYTTNFNSMIARVYHTPVPPPATPEPTPADIAAIDSLIAEANQEAEEEVCELV